MKLNRFAIVAGLLMPLVWVASALSQPTVSSTFPPINTNIAFSTTSIGIIFSEPMNAGTIHTGSFVVYGELTGNSLGTVSYGSGDMKAKFDPAFDFLPGEKVTVILTSTIESAVGVPLTPYIFEYRINRFVEVVLDITYI